MWKLEVADGGKDPYTFSTNNFVGRQIWKYVPEAGSPEQRAEVEVARQRFFNNRFKVKACGDLLCRFQVLRENNFKQTIPSVKIEDGEEITHDKMTTTLRRAAHHLSALQASDGHWPALNAGPLFFLPPLVFCMYITSHLDLVFPEEYRKEILRYIYAHQNEDGGWGLHIEGHSTMFCTALNYICMRMLEEGPDGGQDNACARARKWIHDHGGVTLIPSWGKTWLSAERDLTPLHRAAKLLINSQLEEGDWPQQEITGVFMKNCMQHYPMYRDIFPMWALAEYYCTLGP